MQFCPLCKFMTYTKLSKTNAEDNEITGLMSYCRNCGWEGELESNDNSVYKRNYEEDFIANKIITNKYTIFDVTLPRVEYDCTNEKCITNIEVDESKTFIVDDIPADLDDNEFANIFAEDLKSKDIESFQRVRLTMGLFICKDEDTCNMLKDKWNNKNYDSDTVLKTRSYVPPQKEVLYLKYDSINMRYLYICANCGTSWKKN